MRRSSFRIWIQTFVFMAIMATQAIADENRPNILFLAVDDLRPELGCYGSDLAKSPNIDALAREGVLFTRAYCQQAICSPSRASIMTGARPDTIGVVENTAYFRDLHPDLVTLPQHFIANGYTAVHCGKIFHKPAMADLEKSWSFQPNRRWLSIRPPQTPGGYALPENQAIWRKNQKLREAEYGKLARWGLTQGPAYEDADVPDHGYIDGYHTELAIATLKELVKSDKPFFLGLGMMRPHLNFNAPKKYWDMYDPEEIDLAMNPRPPEGGAAVGLHPSFELRVRYGIPKKGRLGDELSTKLKHGYLACVSYVDAQLGRMINALEEAGVRDNTIIVLWGDHGWHLGDMGVWGKATNYEIATRVPLIISVPERLADSNARVSGRKSNALVELVDLYPTLCELAGLDKPQHLEGLSLKPILNDPAAPWKSAAFSQFPSPALREWAANPLSQGMRETFFGPLIEEVESKIEHQHGENWDRKMFENRLMGYSMRTDSHRFVVWVDTADQESEPVFVELYDLSVESQELENIATTEPELVKKLMVQFRAGWRASLPQAAVN